jgi:hypothetical protein
MALLQYANRANSTLAAGITSSQTTFNLAAGTGAIFPAIGSGPNGFYLTLVDAATKLIYEICLVTAISTDTVTVTRGVQGTTARAWLAGDIASQYITATDMANLVQLSQLPAISPGGSTGDLQYNNGTSALGGTSGITTNGTALEVGSPTGGMPAAGFINAVGLEVQGNAVLTSQTGSNSNGRWWVRSDGQVEQQGIFSATGGNNAVTFPNGSAFTSAASINIQLTLCSGNIGAPALAVVPAATVTGFTFYLGTGYSSNVFWKATGI